MSPKPAYSVRIKLCQTAVAAVPGKSATSIAINGKTRAADVDIAAMAGGLCKAADLVFKDVRPEHGVIGIRFWHRTGGQAMVQAIEVAACASP